MFEFIKYMIREYHIKQRVSEVQKKINNMSIELNKDHKLSKYKNPSKIWAELQWELFLAKKGFNSSKEYYDSKRKR